MAFQLPLNPSTTKEERIELAIQFATNMQREFDQIKSITSGAAVTESEAARPFNPSTTKEERADTEYAGLEQRAWKWICDATVSKHLGKHMFLGVKLVEYLEKRPNAPNSEVLPRARRIFSNRRYHWKVSWSSAPAPFRQALHSKVEPPRATTITLA